MAFEGLGSPQPPFGFPPPSFPSPPIPNPNPKPAARQQRTPPQPKRRSVSPHSWSNQRKHPVHLAYPTNHERLPPVTAVVAHGAEAKFPTKTINFHAPERNQSPTWPSPDDFQNNYHSSDAITERLRTQTDVPFENGTSEQSKRMRSSPLAFESNHFDMNLISSHKESQRSDISPLRLSTQRNYPTNIGNSPPHQRFHPIDYSDIYDSGKFSPPKPAYFNALERASSPPLPSANVSLGTRSVRLDPERPLVSPPRLASKKTFPINVTNSPSHRSSRPLDDSDIYDVGTISPPKPTYFSSPKRGRSPPLASANVSLGTSSDQHDIEREKKAKVKRLARFNVELSQPMENVHEFMRHKSSEVKHNQAPLDKKNPDSGAEVAQDLVTRGILSDDEGLGSSQVVVGLCPDMCPESERQERERKGDLDKFERLDGERNHTSKLLAVKKYTRTAEREADLIRPMPVLQKTVDYLLQLLDLPYNDNFLGIYNFLWDRMRAIRMDLRMQHIFNYEAIVMLEQMPQGGGCSVSGGVHHVHGGYYFGFKDNSAIAVGYSGVQDNTIHGNYSCQQGDCAKQEYDNPGRGDDYYNEVDDYTGQEDDYLDYEIEDYSYGGPDYDDD